MNDTTYRRMHNGHRRNRMKLVLRWFTIQLKRITFGLHIRVTQHGWPTTEPSQNEASYTNFGLIFKHGKYEYRNSILVAQHHDVEYRHPMSKAEESNTGMFWNVQPISFRSLRTIWRGATCIAFAACNGDLRPLIFWLPSTGETRLMRLVGFQ